MPIYMLKKEKETKNYVSYIDETAKRLFPMYVPVADLPKPTPDKIRVSVEPA